MGQPTFSAIILTLNEEDHICECLEHLAWCDEQIVVDMHSEDRTRERAADLATKILLHEPIPYFDYARNTGIEAATGDWILVVDADEIVPQRLADRLRQWAATAGDVVGVWIPTLNYCFGLKLPHIGDFPNYHLRCFRRDAGRYPEGRLHCVPRVEGRTEFLPLEEDAWIVHARKNQTVTYLLQKWDGYAAREAETRLRDEQGFKGPLAMLWAPLSAFRFRFFTKKGYRDGTAGLVLSVLFAFYRFEIEAKLWEASKYGVEWDHDVQRLRSFAHLAWALGAYVGRGVWRRMWNRSER